MDYAGLYKTAHRRIAAHLLFAAPAHRAHAPLGAALRRPPMQRGMKGALPMRRLIHLPPVELDISFCGIFIFKRFRFLINCGSHIYYFSQELREARIYMPRTCFNMPTSGGQIAERRIAAFSAAGRAEALAVCGIGKEGEGRAGGEELRGYGRAGDMLGARRQKRAPVAGGQGGGRWRGGGLDRFALWEVAA